MVFMVLSLSLVTKADSQGILQPNLIPFQTAGSTQLEDGTVLVLEVSYTGGGEIWKSLDQGLTWNYVRARYANAKDYCDYILNLFSNFSDYTRH